jgi:protein O-mannosyl-transferase
MKRPASDFRPAWFMLDSRMLMAAVVATALLVYANSLGNGFALDDVLIIRDNHRIHDLANIRDILLAPYWPLAGVELGLWRPLTTFAFSLQWVAGGGNPAVFHTVSIILHALCTALVFLLIQRLANYTAAAVGALIFAVHPVHVEAVANIVGQSELIAAAATLGACLVHASRPAGAAVSGGRAAALAGLFAVGILSKENAVVMPGLLVAVDVAQRRVSFDRLGVAAYARALSFLVLPLAMVAGVYLILRWQVLDGALLGVEAGPQLHFLREEHRLLNAFRAVPEVVRLLVFPSDLAADYAPSTILPVESWTVMTALGLVLLAAIVTLASAAPWRPDIGVPGVWFLVSFITVSNLIFPVGVLLAERTLYLPSVAISFIAASAWLVLRRTPRHRTRRLAAATLAILVLLGAGRTWVRNPDWKDTHAVQYALMRDHPESYKAQWTYAVWQARTGNTAAARPHFEAAYRIYPRDSQLMAEYGTFLLDHGETDYALWMLESAHSVHPRSTGFAIRLANAYLHTGRLADAERVADHLDVTVPSAATQIREAVRRATSSPETSHR